MQNLGDRTTYIGASEVPIIMGSLYNEEHKKTRWHLWASKVGHPDYVPPSPGEEAEVGHLAEDFLRRYAELVLDCRIDRRNTTRRLQGTPILAHLDFCVREEQNGAIPLEVKTSGLFGARTDGWSRNSIPLHVYHQVQTQIAAADAPKGYVVALLGWMGLVGPLEVERDDKCIQDIIEKCKDFWRCVETRQPPEEMPYDQDIAVKLPRSGQVNLPMEIVPLLREYRLAQRQASEAEARKEEIKKRIITVLGSAESGTVGGWFVSVKKITQQRVDSKRLREQFPDVYERCLSATDYLRLTVRPPEEEE